MSKVNAVPEGLRSVTPQLTLPACVEALAFYAKAFGAKEKARAADPSGKKIWHAELQIGDSVVFANDAFPEMGGPGPQVACLWLYGEDVDGRFARAVEAGVKVVMPPADMFWGDRMCKVTDPWGNEWCLAQRTRNMTPEEMKKAEAEFVAQMGAKK
jgi:uncharacterized glyoxalase superfamily protein PhnB